jgi:hypothetical protein
MASTFYVKTSRAVGTSLTSVGSYTVGASTQTTAIGLTVANILTDPASTILVNATVYDGVNDTYIVRNASVPYGSSIVLIGGEQKIVLQTGYSIRVQSNTASSADVVLSILELTP